MRSASRSCRRRRAAPALPAAAWLAARTALTGSLVAGLGGCAQLFGLDETSLEPPVVRFSLQRYAVGASLVVEPMDVTAGSATYLLPDPVEASGFRKVPATSTGVGLLQGDVAAGTPAYLRFTLPDDNVTRLVALPQRSISGLYGYLGKPAAPDAAPAGASLAISVTIPAHTATSAYQWLSLGAWTIRDFVGAELPPTIGATQLQPASPIPYTSATVLSRPPTGATHPQLHADDALLILRRDTAQLGALTDVFTAAPLELTAGMNSVAGAMVPVNRDESMSVEVDPTGATERLKAVQPAPIGEPTFNWAITAAPGSAAGIGAGPALALGSLASTAGATTLSPVFGNPFKGRGWASTFSWVATASRTYTPAGLAPVTLTTRLTAISPVPVDGMRRDFTSCIPGRISIQAAALITDGVPVTIDRGKAIGITANTDRLDSELYSITLLEVVNNGGVGSLVPRFEALADRPAWTVPGDVFELGKTYTLRATCSRGGYPGLTTGDLATRQLPVETGSLDSGVFTVMQ
jgi:hypothetical protein